jgi:hypothetical protein
MMTGAACIFAARLYPVSRGAVGRSEQVLLR